MLPFLTLLNATSNGPGVAHDLERTSGKHTLAVTVTGGPTAANVIMQGSHDGSTWFNLLPSVAVDTNPPTVTVVSVWRYVRAVLSGLSGGTSPTVTATIASE